MATGTVVVVLLIGAAAVLNPTVSPAKPTPTSLSGSVVPPFSEWVSFSSPEGRFSASFPGQPDDISRPAAKNGGVDAPVETFEWAPGDAAVRFTVAYIDYPAGSLSTLSPETGFANIEQALTSDGATVLGSRDLGGDYPGHEFELTHEGEPTTFRAWLVGDRVYEVGVQGGSPDTAAFLDSFRITAE